MWQHRCKCFAQSNAHITRHGMCVIMPSKVFYGLITTSNRHYFIIHTCRVAHCPLLMAHPALSTEMDLCDKINKYIKRFCCVSHSAEVLKPTLFQLLLCLDPKWSVVHSCSQPTNKALPHLLTVAMFDPLAKEVLSWTHTAACLLAVSSLWISQKVLSLEGSVCVCVRGEHTNRWAGCEGPWASVRLRSVASWINSLSDKWL